MNSVTSVLAALVIVALSGSLAAAREESRTVSKPYTITRGELHVSSEEAEWWVGSQPVLFHARAHERWLTLTIVDDTGQPVRARADIEGHVIEFCSATEKRIQVNPEHEIAVSAIFGTCDGALSVVTEGVITAAFSR